MFVLDGNFAVGRGNGTDYPYTYISMYARTNRCYNEGGCRTNYVRSSIPHCTWFFIGEYVIEELLQCCTE
jgi:hypothetical protein